MVVLLELDEDAFIPHTDPRCPTDVAVTRIATAVASDDQRASRNNNTAFAAALACYPYAFPDSPPKIHQKLNLHIVQYCFTIDKLP